MGAHKSKPQHPDGIAGARHSRTASAAQPVDLSAMGARIDRVHIAGLLRTHDDYVQQAVATCFTATTFQDLLVQVGRARNRLQELGAFKADIHANVDVSRGPHATPNGYEVTFETAELSRIVGSVGTEVGNHEGALTMQLRAPNLLGRGESVTLNGSYSNCKSTDLNLRFEKPFLHTRLYAFRPQLAASVFKSSTAVPWFRYTTHDLGAQLEFSFLLPAAVHHSLQYELAAREVGHVARQVPFHVREHCGPRLAGVLRHVGTFDQRDSRIFPTRGCYVQTTNELCGAAGVGDVQYVKHNTHAEWNVPLPFGGMSVQLCGRLGAVQSDRLAEGAVPLGQRFVLGGPLTVRGFQMAGVGEHVDGVPTGAHTYWAAGAHLWSPLPFTHGVGGLADWFRVHGWATVGGTDAWTAAAARCSVGAGLAVRIGERARIEFNYCRPLARALSDAALKEGFQFGIGVEFL